VVAAKSAETYKASRAFMIQSGKLKITEQEVHGPAGDVLVVHLRGELTLGKESVLLRDYLRQHFDAGSHHILLVLEQLTFMDSTGIGVLVELKAHAVHGKGDVRLCRSPGFVTKILFRLALHRILEVFETEEAALHDWGTQAASSA
jgi:stage II sporulation protein AA (anti-sigma F factor antagonist)